MAFCRIVRVKLASYYPVEYVDRLDGSFKTEGERLESCEDHFHISLFFENLGTYGPCLPFKR